MSEHLMPPSQLTKTTNSTACPILKLSGTNSSIISHTALATYVVTGARHLDILRFNPRSTTASSHQNTLLLSFHDTVWLLLYKIRLARARKTTMDVGKSSLRRPSFLERHVVVAKFVPQTPTIYQITSTHHRRKSGRPVHASSLRHRRYFQ